MFAQLRMDGDTKCVFAVAGADRNWFWATPHIEGNRVILMSPVVPNPMYARYALQRRRFARTAVPNFAVKFLSSQSP